MAEETSQILAIGESVLKTACRQVKRWQEQGLPRIGLAVNLSARQFQQTDLPLRVAEILRVSGLDPDILELEITESSALAEIEKGIATMRALHRLGVKLAIDDFGVGYASLGYIRQFPIQTLKVDQSFIARLSESRDDDAITAAIIAMGHSLNLTVVAEGVETAEQLDFLRRHRCDRIQGYYFSRPLPASRLEHLLREGRRLPNPEED